MNTLKELQNHIEKFNKENNTKLSIDSIRIEFRKEHKLKKIKELGKWNRLKKNSNILHKLKNRLAIDEVTSAYQLDNHNIYFYNSNKDKPKYRIAEIVIFGMKQYHKEPPPYYLIETIVNIITYKNSKIKINIDVCNDSSIKPNINALEVFFDIKQYRHKNGLLTDTFYLNDTYTKEIEKVCIYNKALKNDLKTPLWRIEAKIHILDIKVLNLPLIDFKELLDTAKVLNIEQTIKRQDNGKI